MHKTAIAITLVKMIKCYTLISADMYHMLRYKKPLCAAYVRTMIHMSTTSLLKKCQLPWLRQMNYRIWSATHEPDCPTLNTYLDSIQCICKSIDMHMATILMRCWSHVKYCHWNHENPRKCHLYFRRLFPNVPILSLYVSLFPHEIKTSIVNVN